MKKMLTCGLVGVGALAVPLGASLALPLGAGATAGAVTACTPTGFVVDNINLTAAVIDPPATVTGTIDATGCNIGVYFDSSHTGTVSATVKNANYFGIVNNGSTVNVTNSKVMNIGENPIATNPLNGLQHGVGIYFGGGNSKGTIESNAVFNYQKNGIVVDGVGSSATISGNTVTGQGPVGYIAQNGIEVGYGAIATVSSNTVSANQYSGPGGASSAGILVFGGPWLGSGVPYTTGVSVSHNTVTNNDVGVYLYNAALDGSAPLTATNDSVVNNTISDGLTSNVSGNGTGGYQAGISDFGNHDNIVNNKISGNGYTATPPPGSVYKTIDIFGSTSPHVK
jgi:hypothetical protein